MASTSSLPGSVLMKSRPLGLRSWRWWILRQISFHFRYAHGHRGDSADNVCFIWVSKLADLSARLGTGNQNQLVPIQFTPTAGVTISELDEIDRAVEFVLPITSLHLVLPFINLDERSGADQGIKRVIVKPEVSTKTVLQIHLLQK